LGRREALKRLILIAAVALAALLGGLSSSAPTAWTEPNLGQSVEVVITIEPLDATNVVGEDHTVTATLTDLLGNPQPGILVTFEIVYGTHAGASGTCSPNADCTTDANGQVSFTYTGLYAGFHDEIVACFTDEAGSEVCSQIAIKYWVPPPLVIDLEPDTDSNVVGEDHTVTATLTAGGDPVSSLPVSFTVTSGPNAGASGTCSPNADCSADANGQVSFTYTGAGGVGTDVIRACNLGGIFPHTCDEVTKEWVPPLNTPPEASCTESVNPAGKKIPPAGKSTLPGPKGGQNEDGFYELGSEDAEDGTAPVFVTNASGSATLGPFPSGSVVKITEAPGATPKSKPMGGPNSAVAAHIILDSDAYVFAVDSAGAVSPMVSCLVPPPPK
jgi:hypothetical protein